MARCSLLRQFNLVKVRVSIEIKKTNEKFSSEWDNFGRVDRSTFPSGFGIQFLENLTLKNIVLVPIRLQLK